MSRIPTRNRAGQRVPLFVIADRQEGKTTALVEWLRGGVETPGRYPGFSRVLVVPSIQHALHVRKMFEVHPAQVYSVEEVRRAHIFDPEVEVAFDDADTFLHGLLKRRGRLVLASATGVAVTPAITAASLRALADAMERYEGEGERS